MKLISHNDCSKLAALENDWDRLSQQGFNFIPAFSELRNQLETSGAQFRLLAAADESSSRIEAMACFVYSTVAKSYEIATHKLLDVPVREVSLVGSCVLGEASVDIIREFFHTIIKGSHFDLINLGEMFINSPLYNAVTNLGDGFVAWNAARKTRLRWIIRLPRSFDDYLASLRETTMTHIARDCRKFEKLAPEFRVFQSPSEVAIFLNDAEKVSRLTYQWKLGRSYGFKNEANTQSRLTRLADNGNLRCYIFYVREEPCAFGWGILCHRKFCFEKTGYDPNFRQSSPGTALIMRMINDLIENTDCEVFDFMWGGNDGYKSRLGTMSLRCAPILIARLYSPYSLLIFILDYSLNLIKTLAGIIIERGPLKRLLRRARRRHGIGTY